MRYFGEFIVQINTGHFEQLNQSAYALRKYPSLYINTANHTYISDSQYIYFCLNYRTKLMHITLLLILILTAVHAQNNVCYANCKQGQCALTNALNCTGCDPGLININARCVSNYLQPDPLTRLKPNRLNTLLDGSDQDVSLCSINQQGRGITNMLFKSVLGNSLTQQFNIPSDHNYIRLKFNSALFSSNSYTQTLSLLINIVPTSNLRTFLLSQTASIDPTVNSVSCNSTLQSINRYYGVYFLDYQISSSERNIVLQVSLQGLINTYIAASDFELYYGSCGPTCATCTGPTSNQCTSCRGLLTELTQGQCTTCPPAFYLNVTCLPCPSTCQSCLFNTSVICTACKSMPGVTVTLTNGECRSSQYYLITLVKKSSEPFELGTWESSEVAINPTTYCGQYQLLGGVSIGRANSVLTYTIQNLPLHTKLYLRYNLFLIDQNQGDTYQYTILLDSQSTTRQFTIPSVNTTNECGSQQVDYLKEEALDYDHNATSAIVQIQILISYLGVSDFLLILDNPTTDPNCLTYFNNSCQSCRKDLIPVNGSCSACLQGYRLSQDPLECLPCQMSCLTCTYSNGQSQCTSCRDPLQLEEGFCVDATSSLYSSQLLTSLPLSSQKIAWTYYPPLQSQGMSTCDSTPMIGTSHIVSKFLSMWRYFTALPAHKGIIISFKLYQIDDDYLSDYSLTFTVGGTKYTVDNITGLKQTSSLKKQLCGNESLDNEVVVEIRQENHSGAQLDVRIDLNRMGKIGINEFSLYLLGMGGQTKSPFQVEVVPAYSVNTPADKGIGVKLIFPEDYTHLSNLSQAFQFTVTPQSSNRRLQQGYANSLLTNNASSSGKEIYYLLNLTQDQNDQQLQIRAKSPQSVLFQAPTGQSKPLPQQKVSSDIPRYLDIDQGDVSDRSSLRNLYNLFRGCAILALFIGMASFIFAMSPAFDDFFILCQIIFVHVFIQMAWNPPSLRVPLNGLHIVQFLEWLPAPARTGIEQGILPNNLYQPTPLIFQQYFTDIAFARMIYHTILFFALILSLWLLMHIILSIYESQHKNEKVEYENFFIYYYKQYSSKGFVFVDKMVRFAYFTICWACILQFIQFKNQPSGFHIWNSILCVVMFTAVVAYPIVMWAILRNNANNLSDATFNNAFQQIRIDKEKLYYYPIRYYKLLIIAIVIAACYNTSPVAPLIILILIHSIDAVLLISLKPLGMVQQELINSFLFYPEYPKIYHITTIIQQILFILMEIFFLIMVGIRNSGSSSAYMGLGYVVCVWIILLLLNGLFRMVWGVLRYMQFCYLQREANYMSIQKQVRQNEPNEQQPILNELRSQQQLSRRDLASRLFNSKKMSYVSKIR